MSHTTTVVSARSREQSIVQAMFAQSTHTHAYRPTDQSAVYINNKQLIVHSTRFQLARSQSITACASPALFCYPCLIESMLLMIVHWPPPKSIKQLAEHSVLSTCCPCCYRAGCSNNGGGGGGANKAPKLRIPDWPRLPMIQLMCRPWPASVGHLSRCSLW